jgi:hypothetical protein
MSAKPFRREHETRTWSERARIFGPAALLSLLALIVTYHFVQPAPPHHIVFATGHEGGAYFLLGLRYQEIREPNADLDSKLAELDRLEANVGRLSVPLAYANPLYTLRSHIALLRDELRQGHQPRHY